MNVLRENLLTLASNLDPDAFATTVPFFAPQLARTAVDWNYTTTPQPGFNNRAIVFERGYVLGGSSSISQPNIKGPLLQKLSTKDGLTDYLAYQRGSNHVYDRWAKETEDEGWTWKEVEKYYLKVRHITCCVL